MKGYEIHCPVCEVAPFRRYVFDIAARFRKTRWPCLWNCHSGRNCGSHSVREQRRRKCGFRQGADIEEGFSGERKKRRNDDHPRYDNRKNDRRYEKAYKRFPQPERGRSEREEKKNKTNETMISKETKRQSLMIFAWNLRKQKQHNIN